MFTVRTIFNALPAEAGRVVGICNFRDVIILACEYHVYELQYDPTRMDYRLKEVKPSCGSRDEFPYQQKSWRTP